MLQTVTYFLRRRLLKMGHLVALFVAMSLICIPGLWAVLNSFRPRVEIMAEPHVWIPTGLNLDLCRAMFGAVPVGLYIRNSPFNSLTSTVIALLIGMAGRFRGKSAIILVLMAPPAGRGAVAANLHNLAERRLSS